MLAGHVSRKVTCAGLVRTSSLLCTGPRPAAWRSPTASLLCQHVRTAKTKSTMKIDGLAQGPLPPLPPLQAPDLMYPTVMQQHLDNTRKYPDCIVLTRVGDFYEMYFDQVEQYAPLVNLKKAKRTTALGDVPMAGFQYGQLERYLKMFVQDLGKQVAISEQIRLPEDKRGNRSGAMLWDRKVTRIVTAGTLIDETFVDPFESNYLLAVHLDSSINTGSLEPDSTDRTSGMRTRSMRIGLSWVDVSSGDFYTQAADIISLPSLIARINPREIVLDASTEAGDLKRLQRLLNNANFTNTHLHTVQDWWTSPSMWEPMLERPVLVEKQAEFTSVEIAAAGLVLDYVRQKLLDVRLQLQPPIRRNNDEFMAIDKQSLRNLEIRSTIRDGAFQGSLLHAIRRTVTKSGARLLSHRLTSPSMSLTIINNRLNMVEELLNHAPLREDIVALLRRTFDTYRLLQKFSVGRGDADDLLSLARTIEVMQQISTILHDHIRLNPGSSIDKTSRSSVKVPAYDFLWDIISRFELKSPGKVAKDIQNAIDEDGLNRQHLVEAATEAESEQMTEEVMAADLLGEKVPRLSRRSSKVQEIVELKSGEIWIMRRSASTTLERAHKDLDKLLQAKGELEDQLRNRLKILSLTLKWSAQLGHFCHIKGKDAQGTLSTLQGARSIGSTKSTRTFYFPDWTELGVRIDNAKLRIRTEEERVFGKLRGQVLENIMRLRRNAAVLDELDVACSSATLAAERRLSRPILNNSTSHKIIGGRHPTVDVGLKDQGRRFTSNDCRVGDDAKLYLITGPNMAGKSTYLRQNALITILAQTGCFVPAESAEIGLVDQIFSRVGSADNLFQDQSTFMVEMLETADILKQATPRSFVIMDEVGRGTTPEDGVAVGYACLHHLHHTNQCRALFATHFHALADMTTDFDSLACYCTNVAEDEEDGSWTYVHKLKAGVNRSSHALKVARLAGVPEEAISVAAEVLASLQREDGRFSGTAVRAQSVPPPAQKSSAASGA